MLGHIAASHVAVAHSPAIAVTCSRLYTLSLPAPTFHFPSPILLPAVFLSGAGTMPRAPASTISPDLHSAPEGGTSHAPSTDEHIKYPAELDWSQSFLPIIAKVTCFFLLTVQTWLSLSLLPVSLHPNHPHPPDARLPSVLSQCSPPASACCSRVPLRSS